MPDRLFRHSELLQIRSKMLQQRKFQTFLAHIMAGKRQEYDKMIKVVM